jgi:hypothetical protein
MYQNRQTSQHTCLAIMAQTPPNSDPTPFILHQLIWADPSTDPSRHIRRVGGFCRIRKLSMGQSNNAATVPATMLAKINANALRE